jgi:hypothetical protein
MSIRKRSVILGIILCLFFIVYATAKINSYILVEYVVERTLIQKCSPETDATEVRRRFQELLAAFPDKSDRTDVLFRISNELEKVQILSPRDLDELLDPGMF